jgi:RNA polymerase sigma-70 factor (ECF subfamily)
MAAWMAWTAGWSAEPVPETPHSLLRTQPPTRFLAGLLSPSAFATRSQPREDGRVNEDEGAANAPGGGSGDFSELFRAYRADVDRLCRRMLGQNGAEDAASEVFLRAQRALASYDDERPFRPWLLGIASHYCVDQLRRRTRETQLFDAEDLSEHDLRHPGASPLRQLAEIEQRRAILSALDSLPHKYRLPLVLRYFEELDYGAIAEVLNVKRPQVGTLLFRAKRRLRAALAAQEEGNDS